MAKRIVDLLEFIEVDHQQRDFPLLYFCLGQRCTQVLMQLVTVGYSGQRVVLRQIANSFRLTLARRNIAHDRAILQPIKSLPLGEAGFQRNRLAIFSPSLKLHNFSAGHLQGSGMVKN